MVINLNGVSRKNRLQLTSDFFFLFLPQFFRYVRDVDSLRKFTCFQGVLIEGNFVLPSPGQLDHDRRLGRLRRVLKRAAFIPALTDEF